MSLSLPRQTLLALAVLAGLTLIFFWPVIFSGLVYAAPDAQAAAGAAAPLEAALSQGVYPLWNPHLLSGMPSYASLMSVPCVSPFSWINRGLNTFLATPRRFDLALGFFMAGLGVFVYLRWRSASVSAALLGALVFEFATHLVGMLAFGHNTKLMTAAFLPWALWATERLLARPTSARAAALALVLGLQLLSAHAQMAYYAWLAVGLCAVYWIGGSLLRQPRPGALALLKRRLVLLLAALVLGLSLAAVLYVPVANYARYSVRGGSGGLAVEQAGQWSLAPWELLTFVMPRLFGFGGVTYWGSLTFADFPHYGSVVALCLALIAVGQQIGKTWQRKDDDSQQELPSAIGFLALLTLVSALLASGEYLPPLFGALRLLLPLYNTFRAPAQALILAEFALAALAGLGLQIVLEGRSRTARWGLVIAGGWTVLVMLATMLRNPLAEWVRRLYPATVDPATQAALNAARFQMMLRDGWTAAFFVGSAALLIWGFVKRRLGQGALVALLTALVVIDLAQVDNGLNQPQPRAALQQALAAGEVARFLSAEPGLFRILPAGYLFTDNRWAAHSLFSAGGYHAAKLRVYQEFLTSFGLPDKVDARALALLNVRWVLAPMPLETPGLEAVGRAAIPAEWRAGQSAAVALYRNAAPLPRAWLVSQYRLEKDNAAALAALRQDGFDPAHQVVLIDTPAIEPRPGGVGSVEALEYRLHGIKLRTQSDSPRLLVLSEVYYPQGWRAMVDGHETPILQANHAFRAIALEAGEHRVEFRFEPWDVRVGLVVSVTAAVVIAAAFGWSLCRRHH